MNYTSRTTPPYIKGIMLLHYVNRIALLKVCYIKLMELCYINRIESHDWNYNTLMELCCIDGMLH